MHEAALTAMYVWTSLSVVLAVAALGLARTGNWQRAKQIADAALWAPLLWPLLLAWFWREAYAHPIEPEHSSKAAALARTIATSMNLAPLGLPAWLIALAVRRRARRTRMDGPR